MPPRIHLSDVKDLIGKEIGISKWITVDQTMIDRFAEATDDHQFIHTDPARAAAETPFGGTIAHGFLSLSLLSAMNFDCLPRVIEQTMGINYGFDKVRFSAPVKVGKRIRTVSTLGEVAERKPGNIVMRVNVTVEIEGEDKPALVAEWLSLHVVG